ncbi:hypothetical protein ES702_03088 [subsurface metagenome]
MGSKTYIHKTAAFRELMLKRLRANKYKGGWKDASLYYLQGRLLDEVVEVVHTARYAKDHNIADLAGECADVANFAMMIADITGGLDNKEKKGEKGCQ